MKDHETQGLSIVDVSHAYDGNSVVREVSLAVPPGRVACLLGPSGCGKTTLLRLAAGLEPLQEGHIAIDGQRVADPRAGIEWPPETRRCGLMFQDYALFPHLTVLGNILFGIASQPAQRHAWVRRALDGMGMADFVAAYPHTLSGGQQQRTALLRALAPEPRVLLLDEPFSGLDVTLRAQVREETLALLRDTGVATLMVTHDPEEAMFMADHLLVMNAGRVVQAGTPAEIYLHPADAFVAGLFGQGNRLSGITRNGHVATALGPIPSGGLAEGTRAQVMIRPEGLRLANGAATGDVIPGRVVTARLLGRASHLRVAVEGTEGLLQVLVPGVVLPAEGSTIGLTVDAEKAFVFPDD